METQEEKPVKRRVGRPNSSFNPDTIEKILTGIRLGMSLRDAATNAGIGEATYHKWVKAGKQGRKPYKEFYEQTKKAIQESKGHLLSIVHKKARGGETTKKLTVERDAEGKITKQVEVTESTLPSLKAATWLLERRWPEEFGAKREVSLTGKDGNLLSVSLFGNVVTPGSAPMEEDPEKVEADMGLLGAAAE